MSRELKAGLNTDLDDTTPSELTINATANICQVSITHPDPDFTVSLTGTGDPDLNPANGGFVDVLNGYTQALNSGSAFTVLADGRVQVNTAGVIMITGYVDLSHPNNNTTVGAAFSIERSAVTVLSPRSVHAKMPNAGDIGNLSGGGTLLAEVGDIIGVALASNVTGNVDIRASSLVYQMVGAQV